jgi:hypothetical protein
MPLNSPRFSSSRRLSKAAANSPPLGKGDRGRAVHLVQQALLDLGWSMPRSTGGGYSPDGIYGKETVAVVEAFQQSRGLSDDGVVGRNTMGALDREFGSYGWRVRLHFRLIAEGNLAFGRIMSDIQRIYGQYGIQALFGSGESLGLSPEEQTVFQQIDQSCTWNVSSGELQELHRTGAPVPSDEVSIYYINAFQRPDLLGCGGHARGRPACTVLARADRYATAHEVGHVLLTSAFSPVHVNDRRNLMFPTAVKHGTTPVLTNRQVAQMRRHACCKTI